jgi:bifunctional UDP-N-acetylglucosamine pyrophosphorylase/glucosamine-1-phosphate N-acetyltransferase
VTGTGGRVYVVLAAGRSVRMKSALPKVLHKVAGRPILDRVLDVAEALAAEETGWRTVVVVGAGREDVVPHLARTAPRAAIVVQDPPRGTGDAVRAAVAEFGDAETVVVVPGDAPLLKARTVLQLVAHLRLDAGTSMAFLTARLPEPGLYGRVVRDREGGFVRIVEEKDATADEKSISEVNAGAYAFDRTFLEAVLPTLSDQNASGEYYLTDVLGYCVTHGRNVASVTAEDPNEVLGINSRSDHARVEGILRRQAAEAAMSVGVTLVRPETITLDETVRLSPDVVLEPFVTLLGDTRVDEGTTIGQGTVVRDSVFGRNVTVKPYCVIESARVGNGAIVGPFARLREGTELADDVHVGNFVETKKARLEKGVRANHLTYLGDTTIGERTNVGAGVITCNYDGFTKHRTTIGKDVFVGSDSQLVAPVTVGDGAVIAAGTTVTEDVPENALTLSRTPQKNIEKGGAIYRERKTKPPEKKETKEKGRSDS